MKSRKFQIIPLLAVLVGLPVAALSKPFGMEEIQNAPPLTQRKQPTPAEPAGSMPFALKGIRLGMSLEEFRQLRLPGEEAKAFPICSCDQSASGEFVYNMAGKEYGGVTCEYREYSAAILPGMAPSLHNKRITIAQVPCDLLFNFIYDGGAYRLYEIEGSFESGAFELIALSLMQKFGKPVKDDDTPTENKMGTKFPNKKLIWFNGVSSIECRMRYRKIDEGWICYTHQQLAAIRQQRYREKHGDPAQDL